MSLKNFKGMLRRSGRKLVPGIIALALVPSVAGAWFDLSALMAANLVQTTITATTVVAELINSYKQLEGMKRTLASLDPSAFGQNYALVKSRVKELDGLLGEVNRATYTAESVNSSFKGLYSSDFRKFDFETYKDKKQALLEEVTNAAKVSMKAQNSVAAYRDGLGATINRVLSSSNRGDSGEVQQLQSVVQMLGIVQEQLGTMTTTMNTTSRLTSTQVAAEVTQQQAAMEASERRLSGYSDKGAPVPVQRSLAAPDER